MPIFFIGCGDDANSTITQTEEVIYPDAVSNEGKSSSVLGYYGDDVYLGDQKIVGKWHLFYIIYFSNMEYKEILRYL